MKKITIVFFLLSLFVFTFCTVNLSYAFTKEPAIIYDGKQKQISFINDDLDLFDNLKEMMPGDVKTQNILFKLNNINNKTKVFLEMSEDSLSENNILIKIFNGNKELLKKGDYIELGSFSKPTEINLRVVVSVPDNVGNEIAGIKENIDWKFLVQVDDSEQLVDVPITDDNIMLYIVMGFISLILMVFLFVICRDSNQKETGDKHAKNN